MNWGIVMTIAFRPWAEPEIARRPRSRPSALGSAWSRAARRIMASVKRIFPIILVLAIFAVILAATIALRLAIWLPVYYRH
jgi:hypothetical protein